MKGSYSNHPFSGVFACWLRFRDCKHLQKKLSPTRWFKVTFWYPIWRSLNPWKGHLTIPKRSPAELPGTWCKKIDKSNGASKRWRRWVTNKAGTFRRKNVGTPIPLKGGGFCWGEKVLKVHLELFLDSILKVGTQKSSCSKKLLVLSRRFFGCFFSFLVFFQGSNLQGRSVLTFGARVRVGY